MCIYGTYFLNVAPIILQQCIIMYHQGFSGGCSSKEPTCQCRRVKRHGFNPWVRKIPWRRKWPPAPVFLPGEPYGHLGLVSYHPQGRKEQDMTEATQHTQCIVQFNVRRFLKEGIIFVEGETVTRMSLLPCKSHQSILSQGFFHRYQHLSGSN